MARQFASDRRWEFDVGLDELWSRLTALDEYPRWWPWLRRFDADGGFAPESRWRCVVAPPLPYVVRFTVHLDEVEPLHRVRATVRGDVKGWAELAVSGGDERSSTARLTSQLAPSNPIMRQFAALAPPLVQWGHDWVLDQGRRQFVERGVHRPAD